MRPIEQLKGSCSVQEIAKILPIPNAVALDTFVVEHICFRNFQSIGSISRRSSKKIVEDDRCNELLGRCLYCSN